MGKKSSDVAAPDPRLVEAQIKSMGLQDQAVTQIMDLAAKQQTANDPLLKSQQEALDFGLKSSKTAYDQSQSDRQWLLGRRDQLTGLQDSMTKEAQDFNTDAAGQRAAAAGQADVTKAFGDVQAANDRELASMGIIPGSGRYMAMRSGINVDKARALAGAANAGRTQARNEGRMLTDRASNALAGYPAAGMSATGQGAAIGAGGVSTANAGAGGINAGYGAMTGAQQAAGGVAGSMGANATGMWNSQANYKLASDQANDPWNNISGIVGAGLGAYARISSRQYKQDIERVGTHPLGIGIYRFRYRAPHCAKGGAGWHIGAMADEVASVLPEAVGVDADGYTVVNYAML